MNSSTSSVNYLFALVQGSPKWPRNSENLQIFPLASCACSASLMPQKCFYLISYFLPIPAKSKTKMSDLDLLHTLALFMTSKTLSDNSSAHSCIALFMTSKPHCQTTNSSAHSCVALFMTSATHCQAQLCCPVHDISDTLSDTAVLPCS